MNRTTRILLALIVRSLSAGKPVMSGKISSCQLQEIRDGVR